MLLTTEYLHSEWVFHHQDFPYYLLIVIAYAYAFIENTPVYFFSKGLTKSEDSLVYAGLGILGWSTFHVLVWTS